MKIDRNDKPCEPGGQPVRPPDPTSAVDGVRDNRAARALLAEWLADESGYDERVWPAIRASLERYRMSFRARFRD